jgi:putative membrane protein
MPLVAALFAIIAGLAHVGFFTLESVTFTRPEVWARFHLSSQAEADIVRPMALNQGFYNLFLALGVFGGLLWIASGSVEAGRAVVMFACACMVGAGVVLVATDRRFAASAAFQAVPPLLAIVLTLMLSS